VVGVDVSDRMRPSHVSLPNGFGLEYEPAGQAGPHGVAPNELTSAEDRDPIAGTPWHKSVPAQVEAVH
jgi:anaerobic selenocysteine-containing dehydrogenase